MAVPRKRKHSHNDLQAPLSSQVEESRRSSRLRGRGTITGPTDDTQNERLEGVVPESDRNGGKRLQSKKRGRSTPARETGTITGTANNTPSKHLKSVVPDSDHEEGEEPQSEQRGRSTPARRGTITGTANNTPSDRLKRVVPPTSLKQIEAKITERAGSPACSELIQEFFNLTLHRCDGDKDCSEQGSTRGPARYDKHLKDDLRLKKVVYCSDLVSQLGDIAERAIRNYEATPGTTPVESMFNLEHIRATLERRLLYHDMTEGDVVNVYASTITKYIMPIISTVTLQEVPKPVPDMISWTSRIKHDRAVADAVLRVVPPAETHDRSRQNSEDTVCNDPSAMIRQSVSEYFPSVLVFEFKSPRAGSHRHMDAMLEITEYDVFPWEGCNEKMCFSKCRGKRTKGSGLMPQDEVYKELHHLFDYNPTTLRLTRDDQPPFSCPSLTYDKHLDPRLTLRNVETLPTFLIDVAAKKVEALKEGGRHIPYVDSNGHMTGDFRTKKFRDTFLPDATATTAYDVAGFYEDTSFDTCASVASTLSLHTDAETWLSIMEFRRGKMRTNDYFRAVTDVYELNFGRNRKGELNIPDAKWSRLDEATQARIRSMVQLFRTLITYQFHIPSPEAKALFRDLGNVANSMVHELPLQCPNIPGSLVVEYPHPVPADANVSSRTLSVASPATAVAEGKVEVRKSVRLASRKPLKMSGKKKNGLTSDEKPAGKWRTVTIKPEKPREGASSFIHRAWARSVHDDTSFIVFNCGKYERLGFRHRASQTLYLSDLIDVEHCSKPAYGAIHVGLYMIVLQDALNRVEKPEALTETKTTKRKRNDSARNRDAKRHKTRSTVSKAVKDRQWKEEKSRVVVDEVCGRNLMLLRFQYGSYNSPAPASCYRLGGSISTRSTSASVTSKPKDKYRPSEYFYVTLTSGLSEGATGRLHLAQMKVQTAAKVVHECEVVVKVALETEQQQRLRHEYDVYRHLATEGVKQIPQIYGLFGDASREAVILVMNNVGESLNRNDYWRNGLLTDEEKEAFKRVMTDIHQAGVRHYDIRPENLMMDDAGNATIIDFDQAKIEAGSHSRQREYKHLCSLLEGDDSYDPPNQFPSPPTTQGSPSDNEESN